METRRLRARMLARLHGALGCDPASDPAGDRQLDRHESPPAPAASLAVPRDHRRTRRGPRGRRRQPPLRHREDRHPDRGQDAGAPLPGLPALPPRLLRPARDRTGALAGDERPVPHPLLHRLGARAGDPERDDDRRGRDRPLPRRCAADALSAVSLPPIGTWRTASGGGSPRSRAGCRRARAT